ncbi:MAG: cysteine desulfurase [Desulfobacterota bacterium]|nr:cysteine desulfurase [Thermodesulfobacteriota bacterium]
MPMIYLDHNATTPLDPRVLKTMLPFFKKSFGNPSSYHRHGREAREALEKARHTVAHLLGAMPREIVFTSSATEANNLALRGVVRALRNKGRHIITSSIEHHAVLKTCRALEQDGCQITFLPVDGCGRVDPNTVSRAIRRDTILITIMYAHNETGVIQPISDISRIARSHNIIFHTDAVQAFGKIPIPPARELCDLMSLSSHKIYGPKGAGALYIKRGTPISPLLTGGHHEHGLRAGTENVPAIVGFAAAAEHAVKDCGKEAVRLAALRNRLEALLIDSVPDISINGKGVERIPNTTNVSFLSVESESVLLHLDLLGICASAGSACTTGDPEPSHVLLAMGCTPQQAQGAVRFSLGKSTTARDIDTVAAVLTDIVKKLRSISSVA